MVNPLAPAKGPPEPGSDEAQQQLTFVQEFLRTGDPVQALSRAGIIDIRYPAEVTARKLLEQPHIAALVDAVRATGIAPAPGQPITRETYLDRLDSIYHESRSDRDRPAALASIKLATQLQGLLSTQIDMTVTQRVDEMSTEQLLKMAKRFGVIDADFKVIDTKAIEGPKK